MRFLLKTLSWSYVTQHRAKTFLTLMGVVVGVASFSAIRAAQTSLTTGIRGTVDRMAGKAQLQVAADGGVPEELAETIRSVPGVRAQSPVIEQVVVPERAELGSLLVLGVDLLGDREMRDYGFEGDDADLDDPLLFLAQPDSIAVSRLFAQKAGLKTGDSFVLKAPAGPKRVVVRGLLTPKGFAEAYGGNLAILDVYAAQELFGRGRRFDRIEVRLEEGTSLDAGTRALRAAVGAGYSVETPDRRGAQMEQLIATFVAGFDISCGFALGIGTFLIFNAFTVAVNRRRRDVGTLRALGATPRQVQLLFLWEAIFLGAAGGALGLFAGSRLAQAFLGMMGTTAEQIYGLSDVSTARVTPGLALASVLLGIVASLVGAFGPSRSAARVHPTEALARGVFQARVPRGQGRRIAIGASLLLAGILVGVFPPIGGNALVLLDLALAVPGVVLLAGPLARLVVSRAAPALARFSPVAGRLAADSLLGNPRRTSGTVAAMTLSLAFVLGLGGYMGSTKATMVRWMDDILTSDLYVRASANFSKPDFRFPASVKDELLALPGVRAVESYRATRFQQGDDRILVMSIEIAPMMKRTRREYLEGDEEAMAREVGGGRACAVSDNYYRRFGAGVGASVAVPTPRGIVRLPVAAVFRDFSSDKGSIMVDRALFLKLYGDDRVDTYDVSLEKGVDAGAAREAIRAKLAGRFPALVSTRREFEAEIGKAIDAFYALVRITVFLALAVAVLGIVTSLLISVAERTREIGVLRSLGALGAQVRGSVVAEAVALAVVGLLLALPLGNLIAVFMETTVAEVFAGWRMPHRYPWALLLQVAVALPLVSALAASVPARLAARTKVTEALATE